MSNVKVWLLQNIVQYDEYDRVNFIKDCAKENEISIRYAQKMYKGLFKPINNTYNNTIIENNNPDFPEIQPGANVDNPDEEIVETSVKLAKKLQKSKDRQRIERKSFREHARIENAVGEYCESIETLLEENSFHIYTERHINTNTSCAGIINASDWHLNELIDVQGNYYDFKVASQRIKMLAERAVKYFRAFDVQNIVLAITGDILNNSKRLDELLSQAVNRSQATFLAVDLFKQFIEHLNMHFNVTAACVTGNESRKNEEMGFTDNVVTDNYDFTIFNMLRYMFKDAEGIDFIIGDPYELVINVAGRNILLLHGYGIKSRCTDAVSKIKGRFAAKGILIDMVLFGHMHEARIADLYARSSSLCGANAYSERELNLTSRASQNIFIVYENGNIDSTKIDLQITDEDGYDIDESLEAYDAKSSSKLHQQETIFKVVV